MKKLFIIITVFFISCLSTFGQELPEEKKDPSGVAVLKKKWFIFRESRVPNNAYYIPDDPQQDQRNIVVNQRINEARAQRGLPSLPEPTPTSRKLEKLSGRDYYRYEAKIRNDSEKTIKVVVWEYIFLDVNTKQELGRQEFISKETINKGKEKTLIGRTTAPPTGTISAASANQYGEEIKIKSIKYSDGSIWQPQI